MDDIGNPSLAPISMRGEVFAARLGRQHLIPCELALTACVKRTKGYARFVEAKARARKCVGNQTSAYRMWNCECAARWPAIQPRARFREPAPRRVRAARANVATEK